MFHPLQFELEVLLCNTQTIMFRLLFFQTVCIAHITYTVTGTGKKPLCFHTLLKAVSALLNCLDGAVLHPPLVKLWKELVPVYLPFKGAPFVCLISSLDELGKHLK